MSLRLRIVSRLVALILPTRTPGQLQFRILERWHKLSLSNSDSANDSVSGNGDVVV